MTYITLLNDMRLVVTKRDTIYRGENMKQAITFLLPLTVGEIDVAVSTIFLSYIRPDGTPDIVMLERDDDMYNSNYYKYTIPVTCKLSRYPGSICMWLQFYDGDPGSPMIRKSGECTITVTNSKSMDDCLGDHQITALYQLKKQLDEMTDGGGSECPCPDPDDFDGYEVVEF